MKYYFLVGEASGDLHASRLMAALAERDSAAQFRFFGGERMAAVGGEMVRHYRDTAFMGFLPVVLHLPRILSNIRLARRDLLAWGPDVVVCVDYAGFNLRLCRWLSDLRRRGRTVPHTYYYIAPKIWAWKEWRIKAFRRDVEEMFCILPFEKEFFEERHHYPVHYVGNPTADEVRAFRSEYHESREAFCRRHGLDAARPVVALLAGSREAEVRGNLPAMLRAAAAYPEYQYVVAGAPALAPEVYAPLLSPAARLVSGESYALLTHSVAALVTSGTATLETALFGVPEVVCYRTVLPRLYRFAFRHVITCDYISLVNLIAGREVVEELFADTFTTANIIRALADVLPGGRRREAVLRGYDELWRRLGDGCAPVETARLILGCKN